MADHITPTADGSASLEALTEERFRMWSAFTAATRWSVVGVVVILVLMAFFLL
ncbi:hypothetical protein [Rhodopila sp.]|jgi:hypothetical protein|uniref:hypothetical protein n=1 Tax=Rhodopila sp. TaxID=2480087 RepID=UPI002C4F7530|nr:hypothetical protein [Rhodopila sp.]HVZ09591.1 hypothetical protein [Rhodopila sp.]